jgi:hypothetical protein
VNAPTPPMGLHYGMPAAQYHGTEAVSNTMLSDMADSPAHCFALHHAPDRPERKETPAMRNGTLAHCYMLEPHTISERYLVKPAGIDGRTKEGKAWLQSVPPYLTIVDADQMAIAKAQRAAIMAVPKLAELLSKGSAEVSVFWNDTESGLVCRARPDWLHPTGTKSVVAVDVKTISELTLETIQRSMATYGYHRQAAHYSNGLTACGLKVEAFAFAFVSSAYPFLAACIVLDDETMQQGADEVAELLEQYATCRRANHWPAFGDSFRLLGLPTWARRSQETEVSFVD